MARDLNSAKEPKRNASEEYRYFSNYFGCMLHCFPLVFNFHMALFMSMPCYLNAGKGIGMGGGEETEVCSQIGDWKY